MEFEKKGFGRFGQDCEKQGEKKAVETVKRWESGCKNGKKVEEN